MSNLNKNIWNIEENPINISRWAAIKTFVNFMGN